MTRSRLKLFQPLIIYISVIAFLSLLQQMIWEYSSDGQHDWIGETLFVAKQILAMGSLYFIVTIAPFIAVSAFAGKASTQKDALFFGNITAALVGLAFSFALALTHRWA